mgnify:CR=1 FL=1
MENAVRLLKDAEPGRFAKEINRVWHTPPLKPSVMRDFAVKAAAEGDAEPQPPLFDGVRHSRIKRFVPKNYGRKRQGPCACLFSFSALIVDRQQRECGMSRCPLPGVCVFSPES